MHHNVGKDKRFLEIKRLLGELERDYNIGKKEILDISEEITVPIWLFRNELSSFEIIVKYLIEEKRKDISNVAKLTNRSKQGVWQAYNNSKKKVPSRFKLKEDKEIKSVYDFPVSIICNKKFSVLESIVKFLREKFQISYTNIANLLSRDPRTIWTVYSRVEKKLKEARRSR